MRCLNCQYSLANLTERRCPECGREFDPRDPTTFETDESRRKGTRRWLLGVAAFALWALFVTPSTVYAVRNQRPEAALLITVFAVLVAGYGIQIYRSRPRR